LFGWSWIVVIRLLVILLCFVGVIWCYVTIFKIVLKFISVCPSLSMHNDNLMLCDDIQDYSNNGIHVVMIVLYIFICLWACNVWSSLFKGTSNVILDHIIGEIMSFNGNSQVPIDMSPSHILKGSVKWCLIFLLLNGHARGSLWKPCEGQLLNFQVRKVLLFCYDWLFPCLFSFVEGVGITIVLGRWV
jgi:hypothetical protein